MDRPVNSKIVVVLRVIWSERLGALCMRCRLKWGNLVKCSYKIFLPDLFYKTIDAVLQPKQIIADARE